MAFGEQIDDLLDTLADSTSEEVETALQRYSMRDIVGVLAQRLLDVEEEGGGGGLSSPNWCMVAFDTPPALDQTNDFAHSFAADEMTITAQSGSDFSVATVGGYGAIVSEGGGMFQGGAYIGLPPIDGLDPLVTNLRLLWFAFTIGTGPLQNLGFDNLVPVSSGRWNPGAASTLASLPGVAAPGENVMLNPSVLLVGAADNDSVALDGLFFPGFSNLVIWQIA